MRILTIRRKNRDAWLNGSSNPLWYDSPSTTLTDWPKEVAGGDMSHYVIPQPRPCSRIHRGRPGVIASERGKQAPSLSETLSLKKIVSHLV